MAERKTIQISASNYETIDGVKVSVLYALCSDGTIWIFDPDPSPSVEHWTKIPEVPRR
jgi:hypothetical protein